MRLRQQSELLEETQPGKPGRLFGNDETQSNESRINQVKQSSLQKASIIEKGNIRLRMVKLSREGKVSFLQELVSRVDSSFLGQMMRQTLTRILEQTGQLRLGGRNLEFRTEVPRQSWTDIIKDKYTNYLNHFCLSLDND